MRKNNFKKGMAAGAKPFEEKFEMQSEAIERVGKELHRRLDEFDTINDVIIDDLTSIEKKRLYDLNTVVDIAELDDAEREFLLALLFTVSNMATETNGLQKHFVRSVKNYLDVVSPQSEITIASIENIVNINSQKAILQTVMEYLFLEQENHEYLEKYSDLLSYFSVNNRGKKEIIDKINVIYEATGAIGISENYGYVPEEEVIPEKINKRKERTGYGKPVILKGLKDEKIDESMHLSLRDEVVFEKKSILIEETIESEGVLRFVNCEIRVDADLETAIHLSSLAEVYFDNCFIDYEGIDGQQFLLAKEGAKVELLDSEIHKGKQFISDKSNEIELSLVGCYSKSLSTRFTKSRGTKHESQMAISFIFIEDCKFISVNDGIGDPLGYDNSQHTFSSKNVEAKNSYFEGFKYGVFEVDSFDTTQIIKACVFKNSKDVFKTWYANVEFQECKFYECIDATHSSAKKSLIITDSLFKDCVGSLCSQESDSFILRDSIIEGGYSLFTSINKIIIDNCTLKNWDLLKNIEQINKNSMHYSTTITFELGRGSAIRNSRFVNINLADVKPKLKAKNDKRLCDYLIGGNSNLDSSIPIENTVFENVHVGKEILRKTYRYSTTTGILLLRSKEVVTHANFVIKDCEGI